MKKVILLIPVFCALAIDTQANSDPMYTIGPMVNYNFFSKKFTLGVEGALYGGIFPDGTSIDFGMEWERGKFRLYSEYQGGIILAGISAGPCLEINNSLPSKLYFQTTAWANFFFGLDYRFRYNPTEKHNYVGGYFKYFNSR